MKNKIVLDFCIWGFEDLTSGEITEMLNIQPVKVYTKGEKVDSKFLIVAEENGWRMTSYLDQYASFEDQMNTLLDVIEGKIHLFKPLCEKYYCEFSCALFIGYNNGESTPWVHLGSRYNRISKVLNIEFDIDIFTLPME